jgi:hypothetical protein
MIDLRIEDAPDAAALLYALHPPQVSLEGPTATRGSFFPSRFLAGQEVWRKNPAVRFDTKRRGRNREEAI